MIISCSYIRKTLLIFFFLVLGTLVSDNSPMVKVMVFLVHIRNPEFLCLATSLCALPSSSIYLFETEDMKHITDMHSFILLFKSN